jgi:AcrR family transcriptional regulator
MSNTTKAQIQVEFGQKRRRVGRPSQVSLDQILEAVAAIGLDRMTLHNVALALDVTPPALYRHVKSREDLVDTFVTYITARFPTPVVGTQDWPEWARGFAYALMEMYAATPGLADYTIGQTHTSDSVLARHETSIRVAREFGFDEVGALYATRAVVEFVAGWVAREQRRNAISAQQGVHPDEAFRNHVLTVVPDHYPQLAASLRAASKLKASGRFEFSLIALINGLAQSAKQRAERDADTQFR